MPANDPGAYTRNMPRSEDQLFNSYGPVFNAREGVGLQDVTSRLGIQGGDQFNGSAMLRGSDLANLAGRQGERAGAQLQGLGAVRAASAVERADARALFDQQREQERDALMGRVSDITGRLGLAAGMGLGGLAELATQPAQQRQAEQHAAAERQKVQYNALLQAYLNQGFSIQEASTRADRQMAGGV